MQMAEYVDTISRQAVIDALERQKDKTAKGEIGSFYNTIIQHDIDVIVELPSAQPEIVRCKDCAHYNTGFECLIEGYGIEREKDWFCGSAERRTE